MVFKLNSFILLSTIYILHTPFVLAQECDGITCANLKDAFLDKEIIQALGQLDINVSIPTSNTDPNTENSDSTNENSTEADSFADFNFGNNFEGRNASNPPTAYGSTSKPINLNANSLPSYKIQDNNKASNNNGTETPPSLGSNTLAPTSPSTPEEKNKKANSLKVSHKQIGGLFYGNTPTTRSRQPIKKSKARQQSYASEIEGLAKKMWKGNYVTPHSFNKKFSRKNPRKNLVNGSSKKDTQRDSKKLSSPKNVLKQRWAEIRRQEARGLANKKKHSLFHQICQNYDQYAKTNNIRNTLHQCPQ